MADATTPPAGTKATFNLTWGVKAIAVTVAGSGYLAPPAITVTGGGGAGVSGEATLKVVSGAVVVAGSGYKPGDTITIAGGTATTAAELFVGTVKLVGVATRVNGGTGYTAGDILTIVGGTTGSAGAAKIKVLTVTGGVIQTYAVEAAGSYAALPVGPNVAVTGGSGNNAQFTLDWGVNSVGTVKLASVATLADTGKDYAVGDILTITGGTLAPGGTAAKIRVVTVSAPGGVIQTYAIEAGGSYVAAPAAGNVAVTGGAGSGA